jgi:hypothetical protein
MNLKAREDLVGRYDEIFLPTADSQVKYINRSPQVNVQTVEMNASGTYVGIGLKSGHLIVLDAFTMGVLRCFCLQEEYGL